MNLYSNYRNYIYASCILRCLFYHEYSVSLCESKTRKKKCIYINLYMFSASFISRRFGYKKTIIFGLILYVIGAICFYPSATNLSYGGFVGSLFIIACGLATLETCKLMIYTKTILV